MDTPQAEARQPGAVAEGEEAPQVVGAQQPDPVPEGPPPAPAPAEEEPAGAEPTPADTPGTDTAEEGKPLRAAERVLLKRYEKERDDFREQYQRTRAEFENYRKRMLRQQTEQVERANEGLVEKLLPVLDNFDAAIAHGTGFDQVRASFLVILEKEGLERIDPVGKPFDPSESDAVAHEDGDGGPVVSDVLRPGYRWKGRVVRPAMVRVKG